MTSTLFKPADNKDVKVYKPFVDASKVSRFKLDTLGNIGTFIIPPGGHLLTYDGPGNNPSKITWVFKNHNRQTNHRIPNSRQNQATI